MGDDFKKMIGTIPGLGLVAVVLTAIFTLADKKPHAPKSEKGQPAVATEADEKADSAKSAKKDKPPAAPSEPIPRHLEFLIDKGVLTQRGVGSATPASRPAIPKRKPRPLAKANPWGIESVDPSTEFFLVAVNDPDDTPAGYRFDSAIDAITHAMADDGRFGLYHHWLSWKLGRPKVEGDHESEPGVLIFRKDGPVLSSDNPNVAIVVGGAIPRRIVSYRVALLVGENPVSGLHPAALRNSFALMRHAMGDAKAFRLVAPCTTGGLPSLLDAVSKFRETHKDAKFHAFSASATGLKPIPDSEGFKLRTMQVPNSCLREAMMKFLRGSGDPVRNEDVAYLYEGNSQFGGSVMSGVDKPGSNKPWRFRFPLHISRLAGMGSGLSVC